MSYILDALKRSEQERHQGELNHATIDTIMMPSRQKHHHWWPYVLIVVLALNVSAYLYFQFSEVDKGEVTVEAELVHKSTHSERLRNLEKSSSANSNTQDYRISSKTTSVNNGQRPTKEKAIPEHLLKTPHLMKRFDLNNLPESNNLNEAPARSTISSGLEIIRPKNTTKPVLPSAEMIQAHKQATSFSQTDRSDMPASSNTAQGMPAPSSDKVLENFDSIEHLNDLGAAFKRTIPDIRFNSHIYSVNPADRRVMINDLYLREGQSFSGMQIKTIGEFYIVLEKSGKTFKLPVLRDWSSRS